MSLVLNNVKGSFAKPLTSVRFITVNQRHDVIRSHYEQGVTQVHTVAVHTNG